MKGIYVCSNDGSRPFPRGFNYEIVKIIWRNLKIVFFRTTEPISTKLGINHPCVKGIQVCSNEGSRLFPRGDNIEIAEEKIDNFNQTWHTAFSGERTMINTC